MRSFELLRKVAEAPVAHVTARPLVDEEAPLVPALDRRLGAISSGGSSYSSSLVFIREERYSHAVDQDAVERARRRLTALQSGRASESDLDAALSRAREGLEAFAQATAELEATLPERVTVALQDSLRAEVLPVARHLAEVRGLSAQVIRRLEGLEATVEAERKARVEDLALLVDLVASGWRSVERRLDRVERILDRVEQALEEHPPSGSLLRLEGRPHGLPRL